MEAVEQQAGAAAAASAPALPEKLRLGIFADSLRQPRWIVEAFARLAASDFVEIAVIAVDGAPAARPPWLWRAYDTADRLLCGAHKFDDTLDLAGAMPHLRPMHLRQCDVRWLDQVEALRLDVAFALGGFDDYALQRLARYGSWRYFFGEQRENIDRWAGFAEVSKGLPVSCSGVKLRHEGVERIAYWSWSRTYPFSAARNREWLLRKTARFGERVLKELHCGGEGWLQSCPPAPRQAALPAPPAIPEIAGGLARIGGRIAHRAVQKLALVDQWCLAYRFDAPEQWHADLQAFSFLMPPRDRFWADPFALERDGRYFIFFEELPFSSGKGHISMVEVDRDGGHSQPVKVLERSYHLSYPCLIEEGGELFMIPETGQNRTVEAYRCVRFPDQWELEKVLLDGLWCVDATFHRHAGKWWMFVNVGIEGTEIHGELHIYFADQLLGNWTAHPSNPVKSDVRSARPAGSLFAAGGDLYRPAQICAPLYGSGLVLNRVTELSTTRYSEIEAQRVLPPADSKLLGMHTYNRAGALTVIDAFLRRSRLPNHGTMRMPRNPFPALVARAMAATRMRSSAP